MDGDTKALALVAGLFLMALLAVISIAVWTEHVEQLACIEAGNQVITGNCIGKPAP